MCFTCCVNFNHDVHAKSIKKIEKLIESSPINRELTVKRGEELTFSVNFKKIKGHFEGSDYYITDNLDEGFFYDKTTDTDCGLYSRPKKCISERAINHTFNKVGTYSFTISVFVRKNRFTGFLGVDDLGNVGTIYIKWIVHVKENYALLQKEKKAKARRVISKKRKEESDIKEIEQRKVLKEEEKRIALEKQKQDEQEKKKKVLQDIFNYKTQKNLYLDRYPEEINLIVHKGEEVSFGLNTDKINPRYVVFYFNEEAAPYVTDCNKEDCSNIEFGAAFPHVGEEFVNAVVQTKTGMYDKIVWNVNVKENFSSIDKSYIADQIPEKEIVDVQINNNEWFKIGAHDDNGNL